MKILIMGLPGAGKSTLAEQLVTELSYSMPAEWINADQVRKQYNDWDFSLAGRQRQAERMRDMAVEAEAKGIIPVCDFVCPTEDLRATFGADMTIWMDTIKSGRFDDTNKIFEEPSHYDFRITEFDDKPWAATLADLIYILE